MLLELYSHLHLKKYAYDVRWKLTSVLIVICIPYVIFPLLQVQTMVREVTRL